MGILSSKHKYDSLIDNDSLDIDDFDKELTSAYTYYGKSKKLAKKRHKIENHYDKLLAEHNFNKLHYRDVIRHGVNNICDIITPQRQDIIKFVKNTGCMDYRLCVIVAKNYKLYLISDFIGKKIKIKNYCGIPCYNILTSMYMAQHIAYKMYDIGRHILPNIEIKYNTIYNPESLIDGTEVAHVIYVLK